MMKRGEFNNHHRSRRFRVKESIKRFFRMMCLVWLAKAMIKIDGFMLLKLRNKRRRVTLIKVRVKLTFSTISDKHMKVSKMLRYLYGIRQRGKSSKYKHHIN